MNDSRHTAAFLIIPGWNGSGPEHWQTIWEREHANFRRVEQRDWGRPRRNDWLDAIENSVRLVREPTFLVAHSLGCLAVALWATQRDARQARACQVRGALLVAPPWFTLRDNCPAELADFLPMPTAPLPFPSILAASENDPYLPIDLALRLAKAWRSEFVNLGMQGHVNIASGHGPWTEGKHLLEHLICIAAEAKEYNVAAKS